MESSDNLKELYTSLSKMQGELTSVPKNSNNPFFKSKYADLDTIWDTIRKPLTANGLGIIQGTEKINNEWVLETKLTHVSGGCITSYFPIICKTDDVQKFGSAVTYAKRYSLSAMLGVSADEDDDGEATTNHQPAPKPVEKNPQPEMITKEQADAIEEAITKHGYNPKAFIESKKWKVAKRTDLTKVQAEELLKNYKETTNGK